MGLNRESEELEMHPQKPTETNRGASSAAAGSLFAKAVYLGRRRRFAEASDALRKAAAARQCSQQAALDLQAKLYAQQGMLLEADACWSRAEELDPGNPTYADARARLRQRSRKLPSYLRSMLLVMVAGLFFACFFEFARLRHELKASESLVQDALNAVGESLDERYSESRAEFKAAAVARSQFASRLEQNYGRLQQLGERTQDLSVALKDLATASGIEAKVNALRRDLRRSIAAASDAVVLDLRGDLERGLVATQKAIATEFGTRSKQSQESEDSLLRRFGELERVTSKQVRELAASFDKVGLRLATLEKEATQDFASAQATLREAVNTLATGKSIDQVTATLSSVRAEIRAVTKAVDEMKKKLESK